MQKGAEVGGVRLVERMPLGLKGTGRTMRTLVSGKGTGTGGEEEGGGGAGGWRVEVHFAPGEEHDQQARGRIARE